LIILFLLKKLVGTNFLKIELKFMFGERETPHDPNSPFKEKEKGGEGSCKAWWLMEGERKTPFSPLPIFPPTNLT
jgi:hypothetical protein